MGDEALESLLRSIVDGEVRRAGSALSEFGIAWVVFAESSPLELVFESQLDLVPLNSLDFPVFRNEVPKAVAVGAAGSNWKAAGTGFRTDGSTGGAVTVAVNADHRWGPGTWEQDEWANRITGVGDKIDFSGHSGRRLLAVGSGLWAVLLAALAFTTRGRRSS